MTDDPRYSSKDDPWPPPGEQGPQADADTQASGYRREAGPEAARGHPMTAIAGTPKLLKQEVEYLRAEIALSQRCIEIYLAEIRRHRAENERLTAALRQIELNSRQGEPLTLKLNWLAREALAQPGDTPNAKR